VVLVAATLFEGISFSIALRQFQRLAGATPFWEFVRRSKDQSTYTILAEDSAALVGLAIAAVGIALIGKLYRIERDHKDATDAARLLARQQCSSAAWQRWPICMRGWNRR